MTENRSNFCLGIMSYLTDLIKYHQQGSFKFFRIIKTPKQHPLKKQSPRKSSHLVHFYVIHILGCILILVRVINYTCKVENMDDLMTSSVSTLLQLVKCGLGFFSFEEGVINLLYSTFLLIIFENSKEKHSHSQSSRKKHIFFHVLNYLFSQMFDKMQLLTRVLTMWSFILHTQTTEDNVDG